MNVARCFVERSSFYRVSLHGQVVFMITARVPWRRHRPPGSPHASTRPLLLLRLPLTLRPSPPRLPARLRLFPLFLPSLLSLPCRLSCSNSHRRVHYLQRIVVSTIYCCAYQENAIRICVCPPQPTSASATAPPPPRYEDRCQYTCDTYKSCFLGTTEAGQLTPRPASIPADPHPSPA